MTKKSLRNLLNELIDENERSEKIQSLQKIISFGIPVQQTDEHTFSVSLNNVIDFQGIESLMATLLDQLRESCFFGQSDVAVNINIEKESCPQLHNFGIHKLFFYGAFENFEDLPLIYNNISLHLKYIFNALQSPAIYADFFNNANTSDTKALLFPFNREVENDTTRLHYLVENVAGSHFLRITAEELEHSRLNLRRISHRAISNIDLKQQLQSIRPDTWSIFSSMLTLCRNNRFSFKDTGLQLPQLVNHLKENGYGKLTELTLNWNRTVSNNILLEGGTVWKDIVLRILMIVTDRTTISLLNGGNTLKVEYRGIFAYLTLTQRGRNLQIGLDEKVRISPLDDYLVKMEELNQQTKTSLLPLNKAHVIFIHHFTNETLAVLGALDYLEVYKTDTLWVKYSGGIPSKFMDTIMDLPSSVFNFYGLQPIDKNQVQSGFCLSEAYSPIENYTSLNAHMKENSVPFFQSMQIMGMHIFLNAILEANGTKVIVAEDGGYIAPLINRLALENHSVEDVFGKYDFTNKTLNNDVLKTQFSDWISDKYAGSVEHTRNGYDALYEVEKSFGQLAFAACSLAVSDFKVNNESIEVAYSCINAVENILNGQGFVLNNRRCLVLGSLGAIGKQTMKMLSARLGSANICGIDIASQTGKKYDWLQLEKPEQLDATTVYSCDLIFGVIGKSILDEAFFDDLLLNTRCQNIFMASGSTKQFEFSHFMQWAEQLQSGKREIIQGHKISCSAQAIEDPQTSAALGTILSVKIKIQQSEKQVNFYLLSNLMPVNFQYYGVPRETMDRVMTEFVSLVNVVSRADELSLPPKLHALDHAIKLNGELL